MEYHNPNDSEDLFKRFTNSIKQNDLETFCLIKQRLTNNSELTAYFILQLQFNSEQDEDSITLLYYAISHQNCAFSKTLLNLKADPNEISGMLLPVSSSSQSSSGSSYFLNNPIKKYPISLEQEEVPLVLAALLRNSDLVYLLISYGADPLIYDATTREQDMLLREAQAFVLKVRDEWIKAPLENLINNLKMDVNITTPDSDNSSDQSFFAHAPSI